MPNNLKFDELITILKDLKIHTIHDKYNLQLLQRYKNQLEEVFAVNTQEEFKSLKEQKQYKDFLDYIKKQRNKIADPSHILQEVIGLEKKLQSTKRATAKDTTGVPQGGRRPSNTTPMKQLANLLRETYPITEDLTPKAQKPQDYLERQKTKVEKRQQKKDLAEQILQKDKERAEKCAKFQEITLRAFDEFTKKCANQNTSISVLQRKIKGENVNDRAFVTGKSQIMTSLNNLNNEDIKKFFQGDDLKLLQELGFNFDDNDWKRVFEVYIEQITDERLINLLKLVEGGKTYSVVGKKELGAGAFGSALAILFDNGNEIVAKVLKGQNDVTQTASQQHHPKKPLPKAVAMAQKGSIPVQKPSAYAQAVLQKENATIEAVGQSAGNSVGGTTVLMKKAKGENLKTLMNNEQLQPEQKKQIILALIKEIGNLQSKLVIHADLKPENIIVDIDRNPPKVTIIDFGESEILDKPEGVSYKISGTPGYMAPEIFLGQGISQSSDLYSLGVIINRLLGDEAPKFFIGRLLHGDKTVRPSLQEVETYMQLFFRMKNQGLISHEDSQIEKYQFELNLDTGKTEISSIELTNENAEQLLPILAQILNNEDFEIQYNNMEDFINKLDSAATNDPRYIKKNLKNIMLKNILLKHELTDEDINKIEFLLEKGADIRLVERHAVKLKNIAVMTMKETDQSQVDKISELLITKNINLSEDSYLFDSYLGICVPPPPTNPMEVIIREQVFKAKYIDYGEIEQDKGLYETRIISHFKLNTSEQVLSDRAIS